TQRAKNAPAVPLVTPWPDPWTGAPFQLLNDPARYPGINISLVLHGSLLLGLRLRAATAAHRRDRGGARRKGGLAGGGSPASAQGTAAEDRGYRPKPSEGFTLAIAGELA